VLPTKRYNMLASPLQFLCMNSRNGKSIHVNDRLVSGKSDFTENELQFIKSKRIFSCCNVGYLLLRVLVSYSCMMVAAF